MVTCPLLPWTTSSAAAVDSCHVHSSSPLTTSNQVQGARYFESEVETGADAFELETNVASLKLETDAAALELEMDAGALELETDTTALDLEIERDMSQEISKQERYSADYQWSTLKLLLLGQH
jgi:hypothetical protein